MDEQEQDRIFNTLDREAALMERQAEDADRGDNRTTVHAEGTMVTEINSLMEQLNATKEEARDRQGQITSLKCLNRQDKREIRSLQGQVKDLEQELETGIEQQGRQEDVLREQIRKLRGEVLEATKGRVTDPEADEMRAEAESLRKEVGRLNEQLDRSGAEPLETGNLSLQVAELEVELRHADRREDSNKLIAGLLEAATETEAKLAIQASKVVAGEEFSRGLTRQIRELSIELKNSQTELEATVKARGEEQKEQPGRIRYSK